MTLKSPYNGRGYRQFDHMETTPTVIVSSEMYVDTNHTR